MTASDESCFACAATAAPVSRIEGTDRLYGTPRPAAVSVCAVCASGTTEPRLASNELADLYPPAYGPYAEPAGAVSGVISGTVRALQGWLALHRFPLATLAHRPPGRGLDVGCGRGDLAGLLVAQGWRMTGIDPSPDACAAARHRGVDAREGTLETIPLEEQAYDLVVFQHSLEHTAEPQADLERVRTALAPGAVVIITVPNFGCWQANHFRDRWFHLDLPRHRSHFTEQGLRRLLDRAGLRPERVVTSTSSVGLPATIQYAVAGRCLFPTGLGLRVAAGLCVVTLPLAHVANRLGGGGDQLHVVATAAAGQPSVR